MRRHLLLFPAWLFPLFFVSCEDIGFVEKTKYSALQEQLKQTAEQLKQSQADLKKAQQQVSDCQAHKYQIYTQGWRTWRLDTVSGQTCILLTSEQDWKNPKTTQEGCQCEDAMNNPQPDFQALQAMGCFGKVKDKR